MEAIILAGGFGTRLQAVLPGIPKPLAPIRGIPFLSILLDRLAQYPMISKVILSLGYRAEMIQEMYQSHSFPFEIVFSIESHPLGTGGATQKACELCSGPVVWIFNGDSFCTISLDRMYAFHLAQQSELTFACIEVSDTSRYGNIRWQGDRIIGFQEKDNEGGAGWINGGMYLLARSLPFPQSEVFSLEKEFFPIILNHRVFGYREPAPFIDIGTRDSYLAAQEHSF